MTVKDTDKFKALLVESRAADPTKKAKITELTLNDLPEGDVTVKISYSSMNYKDAAAISATGSILKIDSCVPGIDFAGTVIKSTNDLYKEGDKVLATGYGIGEERHGGLAEYARVPAEFLIPLPEGMTERQAMSFGTSGFTAALSVLALEKHGLAKDADVLVTSVGGGVGSASAALISSAGYKLHAITRADHSDFINKSLAPASIIIRNDFLAEAKVLGTARWDAAIDAAGGNVLNVVISQMKPETLVTCCGLTAGAEFNSTVMPFILRGITLKGINSVATPHKERLEVWKFLNDHINVLEKIQIKEYVLEDAIKVAAEQIKSKVRGKRIIKISD